MRINIHAGHNPDGKKACGAVGIIKESTEARRVKDRVISYLVQQGHTVYDCTVNDGKNANDVLKKIVAKCNAHEVDIDIGIHFNSGAYDIFGNKKSKGTEVLVYGLEWSEKATHIVNSISSLGFTNRGVKVRKDLYYLRKTKAPAYLVECCFVDDKDDCEIYDAQNMAKAIAEGVLNKVIITQRTPFKIKCLDDLNIRDNPSGKIVKESGCKAGVIYTIVQVSGDWGFLKSGAGWVTIKDKYVKRL